MAKILYSCHYELLQKEYRRPEEDPDKLCQKSGGLPIFVCWRCWHVGQGNQQHHCQRVGSSRGTYERLPG